MQLMSWMCGVETEISSYVLDVVLRIESPACGHLGMGWPQIVIFFEPGVTVAMRDGVGNPWGP